MGFNAGLDLFLVCHDIEKQVCVLETLLKIAESEVVPKMVWDVPLSRIGNVKRNHFRTRANIDRAHAKELIGAREHQRISRRLRDEFNKLQASLKGPEPAQAAEPELSEEVTPNPSGEA